MAQWFLYSGHSRLENDGVRSYSRDLQDMNDDIVVNEKW